MKATWSKHTLIFRQPAGTSRGVMKSRDVWFITLTKNGNTGIGECAPLPGLSLDNFDQIESKLSEKCNDPNSFLNDLIPATKVCK